MSRFYWLHNIIFLVSTLLCKCQIFSPGAVSSFSPGGQYIMLTINDVLSPATEKVLDILKAKKSKATFFVSGSLITQESKQYLQRMVSEGHEIASHGWDPSSAITKISRDKLRSQLIQTSNAIFENVQRRPSFYRPAFGTTNAQINEFVTQDLNHSVILWSLDSKDWESKEPTEVVSRVLKKALPGDVILCHSDSSVIVEALGNILEGLHNDGYELLTLSEVKSFPDDSPH